MMKPLKPYQKVIAYASLAFVLAWTAFGIFTIWVILTNV